MNNKNQTYWSLIYNEIEQIRKIVESVNDRKTEWSYLTSIEYMLCSKLYMDSVAMDVKTINRYIGKDNIRVLDIGTGCGIFAILNRITNNNNNIRIDAIETVDNKSQRDPAFHDTMQQQKKIYSIFSEKYNISLNHYNGNIIPYENNTFDIVTSYAVIEHIDREDLDSVLLEIKRVLKRNGLFCVFKLPRKWAILEYFADFVGLGRHEILYDEKDASKLFSRFNFTIDKFYRSEMVPEFPGKLINRFYRYLKIIDHLLYHSPLQYFAHHNNYILINR